MSMPKGKATYPAISLGMTDKDVVERAAALMGSKVTAWHPTGRKTMYRTRLHGPRAVGVMMTVYTEMGVRRKAKILEVLHAWQNSPSRYHKTPRIWAA